jgi:hypothetical protein
MKMYKKKQSSANVLTITHKHKKLTILSQAPVAHACNLATWKAVIGRITV